MYLKFDYLKKKYNLNIKGILHIGAHLCEEYDDYKKEGIDNIIWIEGNNDLVLEMKEKGIKVHNYLISDKNDEEIDFNISNNGQSSSILNFGSHSKHYPKIKFIKKIKTKSIRIDKFYEIENIKENSLNFLNIDIQGAELKALIGMGNILHNFDYLYLEINKEKVYEDCCLVDEIDEYVKKYNFERIETYWTKAGWGDGFYKKK